MMVFHSQQLRHARTPWSQLTVLVLLLIGCGGCGRQSIEGTVTLDEQPLAQGYINFRPLKEAKGSPVGAPIEGGKYALAGLATELEGPFRVEITAVGKTGRKVRDDSGREFDVEGQVLPARYNTQSTLQVEIKPHERNEFPFSLQSQ
jgi:hypothetical protein